jgi:hypothetical protein
MIRKGDTWDAELGGVRLLARQCSTCVFRPGNLMHLKPGRLKALVEENRRRDSYLVCHQTLRDGEHPKAGEALCRGFYDLPDPTTFIQIMSRLGAFREVEPSTGEEHDDVR